VSESIILDSVHASCAESTTTIMAAALTTKLAGTYTRHRLRPLERVRQHYAAVRR
jgi:hypothetical protein